MKTKYTSHDISMLYLNYREHPSLLFTTMRACVHIRSRTETDRLDQPEQTTCHSPLSIPFFSRRECVRVRRVGRIDNSHRYVFTTRCDSGIA